MISPVAWQQALSSSTKPGDLWYRWQKKNWCPLSCFCSLCRCLSHLSHSSAHFKRRGPHRNNRPLLWCDIPDVQGDLFWQDFTEIKFKCLFLNWRGLLSHGRGLISTQWNCAQQSSNRKSPVEFGLDYFMKWNGNTFQCAHFFFWDEKKGM